MLLSCHNRTKILCENLIHTFCHSPEIHPRNVLIALDWFLDTREKQEWILLVFLVKTRFWASPSGYSNNGESAAGTGVWRGEVPIIEPVLYMIFFLIPRSSKTSLAVSTVRPLLVRNTLLTPAGILTCIDKELNSCWVFRKPDWMGSGAFEPVSIFHVRYPNVLRSNRMTNVFRRPDVAGVSTNDACGARAMWCVFSVRVLFSLHHCSSVVSYSVHPF